MGCSWEGTGAIVEGRRRGGGLAGTGLSAGGAGDECRAVLKVGEGKVVAEDASCMVIRNEGEI